MRTAARPTVAIAPGSHGENRSSDASSTVGPSARKGIPLAVLINSLARSGSVGADGITNDGDVRGASGHSISVSFQDDPAARAMARVAERRGWSAVPLFPSERQQQTR